MEKLCKQKILTKTKYYGMKIKLLNKQVNKSEFNLKLNKYTYFKFITHYFSHGRSIFDDI
jgi:hypothetical protein